MNNYARNLLALAVASTPFSYVQAEAEPQLLMLEEIVVTARKRDELMQDIPLAVTAMNGDQLDTQGLFSLQDFGKGAIPTLRVQEFPNNPSTLVVSIRGIGQTDAGQVTREAGVGIYVDGVYLGRSQGLGAELADIQSVEVLRGPQGTLFGRNAVGGAVSFTTRAPSGELGLEQTIGAGSDGYVKALTRLSLPEVAGVSAKIDYMQNQRDGWVDNSAPGEEDYGAYDRDGYRVSLSWDAADTLNVRYAYDDSSVGATQNYNQIISDPFFFNGGNTETTRQEQTRFAMPLQASTTDQTGHALIAAWDVSDELTIKSISSYRELDEQSYTNYGGSFGVGLLIDSKVEQSQLSQEIQFIGTALDNSIDYAAGVYYYEEDVREDYVDEGFLIPDPTGALASALGLSHQGNSSFVSAEDYYSAIGMAGVTRIPAPITNIFTNYFTTGMIDPTLSSRRIVEASSQSMAAFGQLTWTPMILDERLHLTFGLRYTEDEKSGVRLLNNGAEDGQTFALQTSSVDPGFTAAYDFSDSGSVYFRYGTAYKAGGTNLRSSTFASYGKESLESYELGLKSGLLDRRVQLNTALFTSTYSDRQIDFSHPTDITISETINASNEIDIYGFEMDLQAVLVEGLTANLSYVYLGKDNPTQSDTFFSGGAQTNFEMTQLPRHAGSLSLDYAFPSFALGDLDAHLDIVSADKSFSTPLNYSNGNTDYTLVNARLTLSNIELGDSGSLKLAAWVHNLTDKEYVTYSSTDTSGSFNAPRMTGLELTYLY